MKHCMIDLETLDTVSTSVILSIGAVKFDLESDKIDDDGYYAVADVDDQTSRGRTISHSTLAWWMGQEKEAQKVFFEPSMTLESALIGLIDWLSHDKRCVWSNGASFDIPMMEHAFKSYGMEIPWQHWNTRCVRTYRALPWAKAVPKIEPKVKHHAMFDALAQAQHVQAVHAAMKATA
jgi:DNA polymerase III epsilon subunit-like protein